MPIERSAGAVVFRKEKGNISYLLLYYQAGHWDFPKGNIERGEKMKETVKREIKEETGIEDIEFIPGFEENIEYFYKLKGKTIFKTVVFFLVETKTREIKLSREHKDFEWTPFKEALIKLTHKNAKETLKKVNNFLRKYSEK
ncbi:MAG: bis(5'-nucleosyl)-tetraphosphatase [Candidatus Nealsonbacteria bacterium]